MGNNNKTARGRRSIALTLAFVFGLALAWTDSAPAQISGIERGGGLDRPYVPPRKRVIRVKKPRPPRNTRKPEPVVEDPDVVEVSAAAKTTYRMGYFAEAGNASIGFRCARDD